MVHLLAPALSAGSGLKPAPSTSMSAPANAFALQSHAPSPHGPVRDWCFVGGLERSHDPEKVPALTQAISRYYDDAPCGFSLLFAAEPVLRGRRRSTVQS